MAECESCGDNISANYRFCPSCGSLLVKRSNKDLITKSSENRGTRRFVGVPETNKGKVTHDNTSSSSFVHEQDRIRQRTDAGGAIKKRPLQVRNKESGTLQPDHFRTQRDPRDIQTPRKQNELPSKSCLTDMKNGENQRTTQISYIPQRSIGFLPLATKRQDIDKERKHVTAEKRENQLSPKRVQPHVQRDQTKPKQDVNQARQHGAWKGRNDGRMMQKAEGKKNRVPIVGYRKLVELSRLNPDDLVIQFLQYKESMHDLLDSRTLKPDWIQLILQIFATIADSSLNHNNVKLFSMLQNTRFLQVGLPKELLQSLLKADDEGSQPLVENTLKVCITYLKYFPSSYCDIPLDTLDSVINRLQLANSDELQDQVKLLFQQREDIMEDELRMRAVRPRDKFINEKPPDDFRQTQTVPTKEDLNPNKTTFLRPIKVRGQYTDVDHYLDVQYRLLREDFIGPLRDGLKEVADNIPKGKRLQDIKVYHKVRVLYPQCTKGGIIHRIQFDVSHLSRVPWKHTKRLIFGSLVCFSNEDFQTFLFATVANRDPEDLAYGIVDVRFVGGLQTVKNVQINDVFTMIESPAYFEAYRYVLEGMQELNKDSLPLQQYIISCESDVDPPAYLVSSNSREEAIMKQSYDLQDTLGTKGAKARSVQILNERTWPRPEDVNLNESQLEAVQQALTREFVVIQGPPGTGKTYVGLRIAHALLKNKMSWQMDNRTPMLIVCYTNHALDQFLTGLIEFGHKNLIRVGNRSTSEELKAYNLQQKYSRIHGRHTLDEREFDVSGLRKVRAAKGALFSEKSDVEIRLNGISVDVEEIYKHLRNGKLLSLNHLSHYMRDDICDIFYELELQTLQQRFSALEVWLGLCPIPLQSLGIDITFQRELRIDQDDRLRRQNNQQNEILVAEQEEEDEQQQAARSPTEELHINSEDQRENNDLSEEHEGDDEETIDIEGEGNALENRWAANTDEYRPDTNIQSLKEGLSDEEEEPPLIDEDGFQYVGTKRKDKRRKIMNKFARYDPMTEAEAQNIHHPFMLNEKERWGLYKYWIFKCIENFTKKFAELGDVFDECCSRIKEVQEEEDEILLRKCDVVGMTTTCAARSRRILRNIKPKIVIVEEAAEVLEAHVLTALSKDTQHLVLIGDHKQLKPNPTVYKLAKDYNLELSLFERMVNNGMDCRMLNIQHRMRPEIARLLKHVYQDLQNHETVEQYDNIKGIGTNMYFIDHSYEEQSNEELKSKSNQHEAEYIVGLCRYLLLQGYKPGQITVLTMYTGQLLLLKKLMPRSKFEGVRVTAVDNFQGEENDIVLLSLVRSNDGQIGFLKTENRICVALSRAKKGLYVIGNFTLMAQQSSLWAKIIKDLKEANRIGTELQLTCQNHPGQVTYVKTAKDFKEAPEGGCNRPCNYRLPCGHVCDKACHPVDPNHKKYKCRKQCSKVQCPEGHLCKKLCHQGKPCGPCFTNVRKTVPMCKHIQVMPCHRDPEDHCCNEVCKKPLKCGHPCAGKCGDICDDGSCKVIIFRKKKCGHTTPVPCSVSVEKVACKEPCKGVLTCGHTCTGSCGKCQNGRLHVGCKSPCERVLVCSHLCKEPCTKQCPSCKEKCQNQCRHSKCQKPCGEVCDPCREPCSWRCAHQQCTKLCSQACDRLPCNQPCRKRLRFKCNHPCIGLCGEKCPQLCRICDKETVEEIFFGTEDDPNARFLQLEDCRHVLEVSGLDHWMEMSQTGEDGKPVDVQLKGCPKCKTPIRRSLRYGNIIKAVLEDINAVKRKILEGEAGELSRVKRKIETEIREVLRKFPEDMAIDTDLDTTVFRMRREYGALRGRQSRGDFRSHFQERVSHSGGESLTQKLKLSLAACTNIDQANILQNQVQFCHHLLQLRRRLKEMKDVVRTSLTCRRGDDLLPERHKHNERYLEKYSIMEQLKILTDFSMQPVLTSQQMEDIGLEISRMVLIFNVVDIKCKLKREGTSSLTRYDKGIIQEASKLLLAGNKIEQAKLDQLKEQCGAIRRKVGLGVLTQEERIMIIRASGLGKGHWFKCPRGHVYAIGDCGGANQESTCPECGAAIGGTSHRLAPGNEHASEFDGSRYAAWSEAANLANFDPQELRRLELGL